MLFLCAWLFFLFGTPVLSIPVHPGSSTPATSQEHEIQRATSTPEDGYWVLKRPQVSGILFLNRGFKCLNHVTAKPWIP